MASGPVPAESASIPSYAEKMASAVGLRNRFLLQTKRSFIVGVNLLCARRLFNLPQLPGLDGSAAGAGAGAAAGASTGAAAGAGAATGAGAA